MDVNMIRKLQNELGLVGWFTWAASDCHSLLLLVDIQTELLKLTE